MKRIVSVENTGITVVRKKFWKSICQTFFTVCVLALGVSKGHAYTAITSSDPVLERAFIAATTAQFQATVITNQFFPGTYQVNLFGLNPNYNPPVLNSDLLKTVVTLTTQSYVYGWADGIDYERWHTLGTFNNMADQTQDYMVNCSSPTFWENNLVSIDSATCQAVLNTVYNNLYDEFFSTPPAPTPPGPIPVIDPLPPTH